MISDLSYLAFGVVPTPTTRLTLDIPVRIGHADASQFRYWPAYVLMTSLEQWLTSAAEETESPPARCRRKTDTTPQFWHRLVPRFRRFARPQFC